MPDATNDTVTKRASLRKLKEAKFLTLTEKGANRTGFKIIRDDAGGKTATEVATSLKFAQRTDAPLLSILLPGNVGESDAYDMLELFGLGDDYEVSKREDGSFMLKRKLASKSTNVIDFNLGDGMTASVEGSALSARSDAPNGVVVTSIEFQNEFFDVAGVNEFLRGKDVAFKEGGVEVVDGGFIVTRHDLPVGVVTKKVAIQDGVTAIIALAERDDVPEGMVSPVYEDAYGNYGWGQLDFAAALADPEFTRASWNALDTLGSVLERVIFYSDMGVDERKVLIQRAIGQFGDFMNGLLDALPREVLIQIRSDNRNSRKEFIDMATTKTKEEAAPEAEVKAEETTAQRTDAAQDAPATEEAGSEETTATRTDGDVGEGEVVAPEEEATTPSEFVTRSELEAAVAAAIAKREDTVAAALNGLQVTMGKLGESIVAVQRSNEESNTSLKEKLETIESQTVVRSDDDDHAGGTSNKGGMFTGIFGN